LIGDQYGSTAANCFWDAQTSGQTTSAGGTGKYTADMKTQVHLPMLVGIFQCLGNKEQCQ